MVVFQGSKRLVALGFIVLDGVTTQPEVIAGSGERLGAQAGFGLTMVPAM